VQGEIARLRDFETTPAQERGGRSCVYLLWCPTLEAYKIGKAKDFWRRIMQHERGIDPRIEQRVRYNTPIRDRLERAVLRHFSRSHFKSDISRELFRLTPKQAEEFEAAAAKLEHHLLAIEVFRLESELAGLLAESNQSD